MMDDDIRGFNQKAGTNSVKPLDDLIDLIETGFKIATEENAVYGASILLIVDYICQTLLQPTSGL